MRTFNAWYHYSDGWYCTEVTGFDFKDACARHWPTLYDREKNTLWGCVLHEGVTPAEFRARRQTVNPFKEA